MIPATPPPRVAIVGGGITGLSAAHRLLEIARENRSAVEVSLLEATGRLGGIVSTVREGSFLLEEGPDSILAEKPWACDLAARLGLADRIIPTSSNNRRSFVVRDGRLTPTPPGFQLVAPSRLAPILASRLLSLAGKIRIGWERFLPARHLDEDESIASFVRRRFGREALERLAEPMIAGVYGADPEKLSAQALIPRFIAMERRYGSVTRGLREAPVSPGEPASGARYGLFVTLDTGLQTLTDALAARLPATALRLRTPVSRLEPTASGWIVTAGDRREAYQGVLLAIPAHAAASMVRAFDSSLSDLLGSIQHGSAATVSLGFEASEIAHPLDGFGFVAPAIERLGILGCTFSHVKYPGRAPAGQALLRAFLSEEAAERDDSELLRSALAAIRPLLGITASPSLTHVARWPHAMPRYAVGHLQLIRKLEDRVASHPGLAVAGSAFHGVGIPDCVRDGQGAAERVASSTMTPAG